MPDTGRCAEGVRLNLNDLGSTLARLWAAPLVQGAHYGESLAAATQVHAVMPAAVFALLCAMVEVRPDALRKDRAPLLELKPAHPLVLPAITITT